VKESAKLVIDGLVGSTVAAAVGSRVASAVTRGAGAMSVATGATSVVTGAASVDKGATSVGINVGTSVERTGASVLSTDSLVASAVGSVEASWADNEDRGTINVISANAITNVHIRLTEMRARRGAGCCIRTSAK